jgi:hypothetical protein
MAGGRSISPAIDSLHMTQGLPGAQAATPPLYVAIALVQYPYPQRHGFSALAYRVSSEPPDVK